MPITDLQVQHIRDAHAHGLLDSNIAQHAGVSMASVKRYRSKLGLETHSATAQRGSYGERLFAGLAQDQGLEVTWRTQENAPHDLTVAGHRVDVKTALQDAGVWRFRLPEYRSSFLGQYAYSKSYSDDCDVLALVCLFSTAREPDLYLLESAGLSRDLRVRRGGHYEPFRDAWEVFEKLTIGGPSLKA